MQNFLNKNVVITTSAWFVAPDGKQYRAVWGTLHAVHEAGKTLGFIPNRSHANWFVEIGNMIIMGCQVLYVASCPTRPDTAASVQDYLLSGETCNLITRPSMIFIAEEPEALPCEHELVVNQRGTIGGIPTVMRICTKCGFKENNWVPDSKL